MSYKRAGAAPRKYRYRLSQADILEAVNLLLRKRGVLPEKYVFFLHRFGIVGEPSMMMLGDVPKDAGQIYLDWDLEVLENVESISRARK